MASERQGPLQELQRLRQAACDRRLSRGDVAVYAVIMQHMNGSGAAFPGKERLGRMAGLDPRHIAARVANLEKLGYLTVERRGQRVSNLYRLGPIAPTQSGDVHAPSATDQRAHSGDVHVPSPIPPGDVNDNPSGDVHVLHLGTSTSPELTTNSQKRNSESESHAPERWIMTEADLAFLEDHCRGIAPDEVTAEWEKFRDWNLANGKRPSDVSAAWRNWVRRIDAGEQRATSRPSASRGAEHGLSLADQVRDPDAYRNELLVRRLAAIEGSGRRLAVPERIEANILRGNLRDHASDWDD